MYIGNLKLTTTISDVQDYLKKTNLKYSEVEVISRNHNRMKSFKFNIPKWQVTEALDENIWPLNVKISVFTKPRDRDNRNNNNKNQSCQRAFNKAKRVRTGGINDNRASNESDTENIDDGQ